MKKSIRITAVILFCACFLTCLQGTAYGQKNKKITISGKVVNIEGRPVPAAHIFIDNVATNVLTDTEGRYEVKVKSSAKTILVLSVMDGLSETEINGQTSINFVVIPDSKRAEITPEVAEKLLAEPEPTPEDVNVGYGKVKKSERTLATAKVKETGNYKDIYEMIAGMPGVEVSGTSIKIAGSSSFYLSTEPLYILDGITIESLSDIAPSTVKSIDILKGPAAAIYGSRGASGVLIITTK